MEKFLDSREYAVYPMKYECWICWSLFCGCQNKACSCDLFNNSLLHCHWVNHMTSPIISIFCNNILYIVYTLHSPSERSRSQVKITEIKTQLSRFQTITPVWIHIWWNNELMNKAWYCLGEVPYYFQGHASVKFQGHVAQRIIDFDPNWLFPDCNYSLDSPMATE